MLISALHRLLETRRTLGLALIISVLGLMLSILIFPACLVLQLAWGVLFGITVGLGAARHVLIDNFPDAPPQRIVSHIKEERESAHSALQQYQSLVKNLAAAVVIRNPSGTIIYCSPYTEVLTGYAVTEIENKPEDFFLSIVHEEDRERFVHALQVNAVGEPFQFRTRHYHKSGIEMWYETRTVPVHSSDGSLLFSLAVTIDVTAAVRAQKQVEERNKDLQDFTYMISHDLKAPIFTLKGMVGVLHEDLGASLPPDAVETLQHIERATQRLEQLVNSILEYSRVSVQEAKSESVDLNAIFSDVLNDYAVQSTAAQAQIRVAPGLPTVQGERIKMYQIFSNLVGNALKYRDPSRPLLIEISEKPCRFSRSAIISVKDNGTGIPSEKLPALFRPFQRGATHVEGLGIGLACVKKLTEKLGGKVEAHSEAGNGTEFLITLRRATGSATIGA